MGALRFFGYGVTIRNGVARPDGDTLFAVGSLSKGFLAAELALLVDEGVLAWDDTIGWTGAWFGQAQRRRQTSHLAATGNPHGRDASPTARSSDLGALRPLSVYGRELLWAFRPRLRHELSCDVQRVRSRRAAIFQHRLWDPGTSAGTADRPAGGSVRGTTRDPAARARDAPATSRKGCPVMRRARTAMPGISPSSSRVAVQRPTGSSTT